MTMKFGCRSASVIAGRPVRAGSTREVGPPNGRCALSQGTNGGSICGPRGASSVGLTAPVTWIEAVAGEQPRGAVQASTETTNPVLRGPPVSTSAKVSRPLTPCVTGVVVPLRLTVTSDLIVSCAASESACFHVTFSAYSPRPLVVPTASTPTGVFGTNVLTRVWTGGPQPTEPSRASGAHARVTAMKRPWPKTPKLRSP